MRKVLLVFILPLVVMLSVGCQSQSSNASPNQEVPYEICSQFTQELEAYFSPYGNSLKISVLRYEDGVHVLLHFPGMSLRVQFPDFANALVIQSEEISQRLDVPVRSIETAFTLGDEDTKIIRWETKDGKTGVLADSYEGTIVLRDQTIEDLVARYGCTNEFYDLSWAQVPSLLKQYISKAEDPSIIDAPSDQYVIERLLTIETITEVAAVTEDHDPNGGLGKSWGYNGCIYFTDSRISDQTHNDYGIIEAGTKGGGAVEVFPTVKDAELRVDQLSNSENNVGSCYNLGPIVIRASCDLSTEDQNNLTEAIAKALLQID